MNKKAYYRKLVEIRDEFSLPHFKYLFDVAKIFEPAKNRTESFSYTTITGRDAIATKKRDNITSLLHQSIEKDKSEVSPRKLVRESIAIEDFIDQVMSLDYLPEVLTKNLFSFNSEMDAFLELHEQYRIGFDISMAFQLSGKAAILLAIRRDIESIIDILLQTYTPKKLEDDKKSLELYLSNVPSLKQFSIKLQMLDDMYAEICMLLELSVAEHPIVIEHIENGSLLARISGNQLAVNIISTILGATLSFCYAQYAANGEKAELKSTVTAENLDQMFELSKKLEEEGYEVDEMQNDIYRSLKKLAKSADVLLGDQPSVEINDKVFELDEKNKTKLLEESKRKLLENKDYQNEA